MSDLEDRVAVAIATAADVATLTSSVMPWHRKQARAAIRVALKEAARIADDAGDCVDGGAIADGILALIETEGK